MSHEEEKGDCRFLWRVSGFSPGDFLPFNARYMQERTQQFIFNNCFCHHKLQKSMLQALCSECIVVSENDWLPPSTTWKGLQSSSSRNTLLFSIFAESTPPTFLPLTFLLEENRHFKISFPNRRFYQAIRKYKLSFPLWEIFLLQIAAALTQMYCAILNQNPVKMVIQFTVIQLQRILQLQGSQSILHFTSDEITIYLSKPIKFDLFSD